MENLNLNVSVEQNDFTKTENKAKLWQLLQRNGAFNGIDSNYFSKVREEFEINIVKTQNEHSNKSVMDRNKFFLDAMVNIMKSYRNQEAHTAADIKKSKRVAFKNELSQKQQEFNQFNAKPAPPDVDFADKEEDSGDVNALLEQVIRDRESVGFSHPPPPEELNVSNKGSNVDKTSSSPLVPKQTISTNVNNDVLQQILDRLNTIEELLRKK